ncbi:MAG: hypothetical protein ACRENX_08255 [Candidatus Dormibacteria bacterium]
MLLEPEVGASHEAATGSAPRSFLPRKQAIPAATAPPPSAPGVPAPARSPGVGAGGATATASFLPRKGPAGRAERQRQQQAHLEPLDDTPAVPIDRMPYLWIDLRKVIGVSAVMVVLVIVGFFVIH